MRNSIIASFLSLALASSAGATPWHDMGPRAMAMGGTGVAMAQGPLAAYWNPAGLAQMYGTSGLVVPAFGIRLEATGRVLEGANDLFKITDACANLTADCTTANITDAITRFDEDGNGAMIDLGSSVALKLWRGAIFVTPLAYIGATPTGDLVNTGACTGGAGCVDSNQSKLTLRGGVFTEIGFGYAHEIMETGLTLGANLKGIIGKVGFHEISVATVDAENGEFDEFDTNTKSSFQPGVDVGLLWDIRETFESLPMRPRFGLVGRNLNSPKFKQPSQAVTAGQPDKLTLQGQIRAGLALSPMKFWHLTSDLDVTENLTLIDGYNTRYFGVGTEINLINSPRFNLPLRVGAKKNLSNTNSGVAYTAGVGLNFLHFHLDIAGQMSANRTSTSSTGGSDDIPNNAAASIQIGLLFGNKDEGVRD